mgnify:FL=1
MSDDANGILFSKSLLPFAPVKIISPSEATKMEPEKFSETALLKIFSILFFSEHVVKLMKINKSDIYLNIKFFFTMRLLIILSITLIITTNCKKDDDSYAYGEDSNPSPSYENIDK